MAVFKVGVERSDVSVVTQDVDDGLVVEAAARVARYSDMQLRLRWIQAKYDYDVVLIDLKYVQTAAGLAHLRRKQATVGRELVVVQAMMDAKKGRCV